MTKEQKVYFVAGQMSKYLSMQKKTGVSHVVYGLGFEGIDWEDATKIVEIVRSQISFYSVTIEELPYGFAAKVDFYRRKKW